MHNCSLSVCGGVFMGAHVHVCLCTWRPGESQPQVLFLRNSLSRELTDQMGLAGQRTPGVLSSPFPWY